MDKKLISNYFYHILYQIVRIILPIFSTPYIIKTVTPQYLGINDFAGNILNWFLIFGVLGVNIYGNRQIAKVRNDRKELSRNFMEIFLMQLTNLTITLIAYLIFISVFIRENRNIHYLFTITIFASMLDCAWFFFGIENFRAVSIKSSLVKIAGIICIFTFVKSPADLPLYVIINSVSELIGMAILTINVRKYVDFKMINIVDAYRHHFLPTFTLFIPTIATSIYTVLDQTMIGLLTDQKAFITYYKTAQSFVRIFLAFITSIGQVMLPRITNSYYNDENGEQKTKDYLQTTFKMALAISIPMTVAMITVTPFFIPWYLEGEEIIGTLIQYSAPIIFLISISNVFGIQYLIPMGRNRQYTISIVTGAVTNFIANLILIPRFQAAGAAYGSVIAELAVSLTQYFFVRKDLKLNFITLDNLKLLLSALIMGAVVVLIGNTMGARVITNIIQAASGVLVYALLLLITKEELIWKVLNNLKSRFN